MDNFFAIAVPFGFSVFWTLVLLATVNDYARNGKYAYMVIYCLFFQVLSCMALGYSVGLVLLGK